ncbi:hypothetical protein H4R26_005550 [Coemansia thaxteri]|uniref:Uncharacterized protein n=1 Tax=Coemansia thaxteri TaxID=2663907 RepID=A0A9W8EFR7_9FUNG|nr:hypothetical protein H4R26_005550 [Coemansia thaxteri]
MPAYPSSMSVNFNIVVTIAKEETIDEIETANRVVYTGSAPPPTYSTAPDHLDASAPTANPSSDYESYSSTTTTTIIVTPILEPTPHYGRAAGSRTIFISLSNMNEPVTILPRSNHRHSYQFSDRAQPTQTYVYPKDEVSAISNAMRYKSNLEHISAFLDSIVPEHTSRVHFIASA